jgi:hypothetical protein
MDETMGDRLLAIDGLQTYFYPPEGVVKAVDGVSFNIPGANASAFLGRAAAASLSPPCPSCA